MQLATKKQSRRGRVIAVVAGLLLVAGGVLGYYQFQGKPAADVAMQPGVDLSPATEVEQQDSDRLKEVDAERDDTPAPAPTTSVTPFIVDASQYDTQIKVRAYVSGILENTGTCTTTFTMGALSLTKQTTASSDATTTRCENLSVARSEFQQAGQWTVVVRYSSSKYSGSSAPATIEVD